jgi:hypothetical protein
LLICIHGHTIDIKKVNGLGMLTKMQNEACTERNIGSGMYV